MKQTMLLGCVFLLFFGTLASAQMSSGFPSVRIQQIKYEPFPAEAGKFVDLFIRVENPTTEEAPNVVCELDPVFPFTIEANEDPRREIGRLDPGRDVLLEYTLRVDANAVEGDNTLELKCGTSGLTDTFITHTIKINVDANTPELAVGSVEATPEKLREDIDNVKLVVEIQNIGEGDAKLTTVELLLPDGFSPSTSHAQRDNLGTITKDAAKEATFFIDIDKNVAAGVYDATIRARYKNDNNNNAEYLTRDLPLELLLLDSPRFTVEEVRAGQQTAAEQFTGFVVRDDITISPSQIAQGSEGELRVRIRNTGEKEAESVSVKIFKEATQPFEFEEIFDFIGNLDVNQTGDAVFTFTIDDNAPLKTYLLDIEIRYVEGSEVRTTQKTVPLSIAHQKADNTLLIVLILIVLVMGAVLWKRKKK